MTTCGAQRAHDHTLKAVLNRWVWICDFENENVGAASDEFGERVPEGGQIENIIPIRLLQISFWLLLSDFKAHGSWRRNLKSNIFF